MVDGFPLSREHWAAMIDQELLPDSVVTLTDEDGPPDHLLMRFTQQHDPSTYKTKKPTEAGEQVWLLAWILHTNMYMYRMISVLSIYMYMYTVHCIYMYMYMYIIMYVHVPTHVHVCVSPLPLVVTTK